jgi:TPR repeat protein
MAGCVYVGFFYQNGIGAPIDAVQAADSYRKACEGGEPTGCRVVGWLYRNGLGVALNEMTALSFYHKACDGGDATSCAELKVNQ